MLIYLFLYPSFAGISVCQRMPTKLAYKKSWHIKRCNRNTANLLLYPGAPRPRIQKEIITSCSRSEYTSRSIGAPNKKIIVLLHLFICQLFLSGASIAGPGARGVPGLGGFYLRALSPQAGLTGRPGHRGP